MLFHGNNDFMNTPQCYVIRTLPLVLKNIILICTNCNTKYKYNYSILFPP
jgi:hypothetical protein